MSAPNATKQTSLKELTLRGIILGGIITLLFTAANVYLGLKVGLTFATSIPAAVISMAVLRFWGDHTVQENNIVQTIASAAGTLSAVIFVLPGLVIVGWWSGFPYWETMFVCAVGGALGVMYSIPLRRALVTGSDLPYPEGVAGAEILKVGDSTDSGEDNKRGLLAITWGALASAAMALFGYLKVTASEVGTAFKIGSTGTMISTSLSLALIGVGHLVGMTVGVAMLIGMVISYGVLLPLYANGQLDGAKDLTEALSTVFKTDVRFIGAGVMAVAAIWTLIKIMGPIARGMSESLRASRGAKGEGAQIDRTEQDIPGKWVIVSIFVAMVPIAGLLWWFMRGTQIEHNTAVLIAISVLFILLAGLLVAAVCGYMAGLIGSSNSPVSGVGLLVVVITAVVILAVHGRGSTTEENTALIAYTLFPLPDMSAEYCAHRPHEFLLDPTAYFSDMARHLAGQPLQTALASWDVRQMVLNVALFAPLGLLCGDFLEWGALRSLATGFGVSLAIELTQYTGNWGLAPCQYRVADINDLITNTVGTGVGIGIAALSLPCALGFNVWSGLEVPGIGNIQAVEDFIVSNNILPLGSLVFLLFCVSKNGWGWENFLAEADAGDGPRFPRWTRTYMRVVLPALIIVVLIMGYVPIVSSWLGLA